MTPALFSLPKETNPQNLQPTLSSEKSYLGPLPDLGGLLISGEQASKFLQGQLTCDINQLKLQEACLGAYCDYKGRVIANFWIWQQNSFEYGLLLPKSMLIPVQQQLQKYALFSKVKIESNSNYSASLYCASQIESSILNSDLDKSIITGKLPISFTSHSLNWLIVNKNESTFLKSQLANKTDSLDDLSCELLQTLSGFGYINPATSMLFTPQMLNLEKLGAVSFRKGCYVGQEVIARTQNLGKLKRHLYLCAIKASSDLSPPSLGAELINQNNAPMGVIFSLVKLNATDYLTLAVIQDQAIDTDIMINQLTVKILKKL